MLDEIERWLAGSSGGVDHHLIVSCAIGLLLLLLAGRLLADWTAR